VYIHTKTGGRQSRATGPLKDSLLFSSEVIRLQRIRMRHVVIIRRHQRWHIIIVNFGGSWSLPCLSGSPNIRFPRCFMKTTGRCCFYDYLSTYRCRSNDKLDYGTRCLELLYEFFFFGGGGWGLQKREALLRRLRQEEPGS
jgi:hypothetical protein